jgi:DNA polymerase elongation subunit (family B)
MTFSKKELQLQYLKNNSSSNKNKQDNVVIKIEEIKDVYDDYIYDLETEEGCYQAGVGNIIIKNTDSIFIHFKQLTNKNTSEKMKDVFELSEICADNITKKVFDKDPINLDFEKIYNPLLLFEKKKYIGKKFEEIDNYSFDYKGVVNKRNDRIPFIKKLYNEIMKMVLENNQEEGIEKALKYTKQQLELFMEGGIDMKDLILSKSLKREEDYSGTNIPHVMLAKKIKERCPSDYPKCGERIPYVFICNNNSKALQYEKIEDPDYVIENNLKIDYYYYFERQIKNPLMDFFEILNKEGIEEILLDINNKYNPNKNKQNNKITNYFKVSI